MERTLILNNRISEISRLAAFVDDISTSLSLGPDVSFNLNLALEEAVSNVMIYAYPDGAEDEIIITAVADGEILKFTISDGGCEFDPTSVPDADVTLSADERQIGGLGIFLIRQIMDEVVYMRSDGRNVLSMTYTFSRQTRHLL